MGTANLVILSNEALVDLGARLEVQLSGLLDELLAIREQLQADRRYLVKPGIKLALSVFTGVAGIALAPITLDWSLLITVISSGVMILGHGRLQPGCHEVHESSPPVAKDPGRGENHLG